MSLTGSRTLIHRSAEQCREIQQRFEHSGQINCSLQNRTTQMGSKSE